MLKNYIITAIRNLIKTKLFSFINIFGLTIGITVFILILHYIDYNKSYDKFNNNYDRIYRLRYERTDKDGGAVKFASCCPPAGLLIREQFSQAKKVARVFKSVGTVAYNDKMFFEERIIFAETEFFEIFNFKFLQGNPVKDLKEPNTAFISKSTAKIYFGNINPIGKIISIDKKTIYKIVGVFADIPQNSHIKFDFVLSYKTLIAKFGEDVEYSWGDSGWFTYILFKKNADIKDFNKKLTAIIDKEINEPWKAYNLRMELVLQPLASIHLNSNYQQEFEENGDEDTINFLSIIAIVVIIIAWLNYINLSTAHALSRAKEVGLRKVVGATRLQLIIQFFSETILINLVALFFTLILIALIFPYISNLVLIPQEYIVWNKSIFWIRLLIIFSIGIVVSGIYPILLVSSFSPAIVLKGKLGLSKSNKLGLRKILVVVQFIIAIILITFTLAVTEQLFFMKNKDTGFDKKNVLVIRAPRVRDTEFKTKLATFKEDLLNNLIVNKFCFVTEVPGKQVLWDAGGIFRVGSDENKNYQIVGIDYDYAELFNLKFAAGRNFSKYFPSDSLGLILNETAVKWLGFKNSNEAIGNQISYWGVVYNIVGVLKDFHQQSLKKDFEPHIYRLLPTGRDVRGCFAIKINPNKTASSIKSIKEKYDSFFPNNPFEYFFLDDYYNEQYKSDELFGSVFTIFSLLAIFVTCLGVLGLSSFMVVQKTKEIGIRKVLGASVINILTLLTKDFLILIIIAFIICIPFSYTLIDTWLISYPVKIEITPILFIIPLFLVLVITFFTIGFYVIKASKNNPVVSLRYE